MYLNYPQDQNVDVSAISSPPSVQFHLRHQTAIAPGKCVAFLTKLGWESISTHPDTGEQLFQKPPTGTEDEKKNWDGNLKYGYWHWYEAMAYEFGKFMGIGEDAGPARDDDANQTQGRAQTASIGAAT